MPRPSFNGISDTDLYRLEQISKDVEERAKEFQQRKTLGNADIQDLTFMVLQLGRICTMQTQALRSIN